MRQCKLSVLRITEELGTSNQKRLKFIIARDRLTDHSNSWVSKKANEKMIRRSKAKFY